MVNINVPGHICGTGAVSGASEEEEEAAGWAGGSDASMDEGGRDDLIEVSADGVGCELVELVGTGTTTGGGASMGG